MSKLSEIVWDIISGGVDDHTHNTDINVATVDKTSISTMRLFVYFAGTASIIYATSLLIKHINPIFDDLHDSDTDSDDLDDEK